MFDTLLRKFYTYDPNSGGASAGNSNAGIWADVGTGALSGAMAGSAVPGWGTLVGGLVGAGVGLFEGISQKNQAKRLQAQNQYPGYTIPQELLANQKQAELMAQQGLPSQQYQNAVKQIQQQRNQAIYAEQQRNAGVQQAGNILQGTTQAMDQLNSEDAAQRIQNIRQLFQVNNQVAGARNQAFDWNQRNRYEQQYAYAMQLLGAGNQNIVHGIDTGVAGLMRSGNVIPGLFSRGTGQQAQGLVASGLNPSNPMGAYQYYANQNQGGPQ